MKKYKIETNKFQDSNQLNTFVQDVLELAELISEIHETRSDGDDASKLERLRRDTKAAVLEEKLWRMNQRLLTTVKAMPKNTHLII